MITVSRALAFAVCQYEYSTREYPGASCFSPLVVHSQGQRWPAGNSTFVCAMKGSLQRNAFTCIISFDSLQLPLGKVGAIVPTLQMGELRLRGIRQVTKITGLARGPKFLSSNPVLLRVTKPALCFTPSRAVLSGNCLFVASRRAVRCRWYWENRTESTLGGL